jgi:hypothetical protein
MIGCSLVIKISYITEIKPLPPWGKAGKGVVNNTILVDLKFLHCG